MNGYQKNVFIVLVALMGNGFSLFAQQRNQAYVDYIQKYAPIAVSEQAKFGIPASITLAQGLLESGAGKSELAMTSNNHFGIKCHTGWTGERTYYDDDADQECFRKYKNVSESYDDHSLFLTSRPRYADLFSLKATDYKGWAHGLKKAGYATDPNYANKLIKIIEDYGLHQLDTQGSLGSGYQVMADNKGNDEKVNLKEKADKNRKRNVRKNRRNAATSMGFVPAYRQHEVERTNGVRCVVAQAGDTYASIADEFDLQESDLLRFNDLNSVQQLEQGEKVYLAPKKAKAPKGNSYYQVKAGDTARDISQRYGIRLKKLYDLNDMSYKQGVKVGQSLRLR
ncbi:MAG: glucosaminidase domain-containing protein [Bacteroidetes bacterium]|uniref:Peptidoglycan hydrolase n=1 Tax=Candidatus Gallipaludibacter merdavium TaxID=2840839 RepID=A0A9D9N520_9BACT|nr:glucosaminidase domain-containing protein [Candidatus Gallipaludibacter merdavium]